jgi:hemolysin activation/secretion protein
MVMASLETGYISLDDIAYVVKYDDLWNPEVSKAERFLQMTFRVAGYSTFFLPPPWNVTGALTLAIVEGIVDSKNINGASNDNPNTFIE